MKNFNYPTYLVGGAVRDEILGRKSKDLDYVVMAPSFDAMREMIKGHGGNIFLETPKYMTIRCNHPDLGVGLDFAVARRDGVYTDGRRPDEVFIANHLTEDLARRDFTINAIAKNVETGELFDPFNGIADIRSRVIRCVGTPMDRMNEDGIRAFRALRFATTLPNFGLHGETARAIDAMPATQFSGVASERIVIEINKAFAVNAQLFFSLLSHFEQMEKVIRERGLKFKVSL